MLFVGCYSDPCASITCQFGDCVNGTCDCYEGYEGADCSDEKTPDAIRIAKIVVTKFPNYDAGDTWDFGSGPDIYVVVFDQRNNELFNSSSYYENAESGRFYEFESSINLVNLSERHSLVLYDYDSIDTDDFMGGVETNIWQTAKGRGFPTKLTVSHGDFAFEIEVSYVFN